MSEMSRELREHAFALIAQSIAFDVVCIFTKTVLARLSFKASLVFHSIDWTRLLLGLAGQPPLPEWDLCWPMRFSSFTARVWGSLLSPV